MFSVFSTRTPRAAMALALLFSAGAYAAPVPGQGTWETTLQARDINGDGVTDAFYDNVLKVTWLADGNAGAGSVYDSTGNSTATDGRMTWADAKAWTASLNVYGVGGWRLPTMIDTGVPGCEAIAFGGTDCGYRVQTVSPDGATVYSEMAHLFYVTLGNQGSCDASGDCSAGFAALAPDFMMNNKGDFRNIQSDLFWTGLQDSTLLGFSWDFAFNGGYQTINGQGSEIYALAVRAGDVATIAQVPEPQSWPLVLLAISAAALATHKRVRSPVPRV